MKLIPTLFVSLSILIGSITWKYLEPLVSSTGTAVIAASSDRNGYSAVAIKIPDHLTPNQHELLSFAYEVAKGDGIKQPQYLQGVIMQESLAGKTKHYRVSGLENKVGDRYFGIGQIKLVAAKAVMNRWPEMWSYLETKTDEELQAKLILDDRMNIRIASKYLLLLGINENANFAITAYNRGPGGALNVDPSNFDYTQKVKEHSTRVKSVQLPSKEIKFFSDPIRVAQKN